MITRSLACQAPPVPCSGPMSLGTSPIPETRPMKCFHHLSHPIRRRPPSLGQSILPPQQDGANDGAMKKWLGHCPSLTIMYIANDSDSNDPRGQGKFHHKERETRRTIRLTTEQISVPIATVGLPKCHQKPSRANHFNLQATPYSRWMLLPIMCRKQWMN